jgi:hypothetical protein
MFLLHQLNVAADQSSTSTTRQWTIKLTQYACNDAIYSSPGGVTLKIDA